MARADTNKSRHIDFAEFVHYILEHEKKLAIVFKDLDRNKDGVIDVSEIKNYCHKLGFKISDSEAARLIRSFNTALPKDSDEQEVFGVPVAELGSKSAESLQQGPFPKTFSRMDINGTATIDLEEFQNFLLFFPSTDPLDLAKFWRHNLIIDIGEDNLIPEDFTEKEMKVGIWWRHLTAGGAAGAVSRTCTAPLDRLKVYLQVHASRENSVRLVTGIRWLLKEGGLKSLWRGNGVNVLKIVPESGLKFMAYEQVLKTRLALRRTGELNRGIVDAAVRLYRKEGLRTFYKGYVPNMCGIIPYAGIDLAVYETLKGIYLRRNKDIEEPGVLALLGCGTLSSTCGQLATYPLALVRTRLQARGVSHTNPGQPDTMHGQFQHILRTEGLSGLYRGIAPNFMKVLPAVGISYVVYETVRKQLGVEMT